ncbi:MAG: septum formation initiator family protein [Dehalococcoidia bacterium]|nr:MAG: septum formation initiator family protein [Dehalococcoidia bacterium]
MARGHTAVADERSAPRAKGRPLGMPVVLTIALVAVGLAGLLPLLQSSQTTTTGYSIRQLERQRNDWEARSHELEAEIASLAALDRIEREARERLHMEAPKDTLYLTVDVPRPESQPVPDRFLPPEKQEGVEEDRSWWQSLLDLLPFP